MIFTQDIRKIVNKEKTETRRLKKPGERFVFCEDDHCHFVLTPTGRIKWRVGQDYAVVPKRGYHGVYYDIDTGVIYGHGYEPLNDASRESQFITPLRIKILRLFYSKPLRNLSHESAIAEGVGGIMDYALLWDSINKRVGTRWHDNPQVWVIKFEVLGVNES